jgi:Flp pilus assembly pilin Flp
MNALLHRFIAEERGDDLVEYALLTAVVAIVSFAAAAAIGVAINTTYATWDAATQNIWEPQAPVD